MRKLVSNIVFTKNRPLQLDAYLESLYRHFSSKIIQTYILYKVELFEEEYDKLFDKYAACQVIKESDFHSDFLKILNGIGTKYIMFGIDDVVFFSSVDFKVIDETFNMYSEGIFGFSLRFGIENMRYGDDPIGETVVAEQNVYSLNWTQGRTPATRYPFELCATIYPTALVKRVINSVMNHGPLTGKLFSPGSVLIRALGRIISTRSILKSFGFFFSPNTLESWNCRWCQNHSYQLPGLLYFQKLCASAIQVNLVSTSTNNTFDGSAEYTVESLNDKYKQGYRFDIEALERNKPKETHCGKDYFYLRKAGF